MKKIYKAIAISILAALLAFHVGGFVGSQTLLADPVIGEID